MKIYFERTSRNALAWFLGLLAPARKISTSEARGLFDKNLKILFIRPHQGLGDLLLATPLFRALREAHPTLQIHFLADTYNATAIWNNPRLDKIWVWDKKRMQNLFQFWSFMRELRAEHFAIALPLYSHVPSFTSFLIAYFCGAQVVWAYDTSSFYGGANWSRYLAHVEVPNRPDEDPEWVKFMELARPLLGAPTVPDFAPEYDGGRDNEAWAKEEWRKIKLPAGRKKIGLFFGGNPDRPERLWPADFWGDLAVKLQKDTSATLVAIVPPENFLSGSRALERGVYGQIAPRLEPMPVFSHSDLARVAAFLKGLDLFICVDGGLFHIAVAAQVPTLGLFFKTDPVRWCPPVAWATVLRPADDQPRSLSPDEVYQKISQMVLKSKVTTN